MSVPKRRTATLLAVLLALGAASLVLADVFTAQDTAANSEQARIRIGYKIAPVPLRHRPAAVRDLVGLGSYIVNAQAACNDCHTDPPFAPGGDPYQGEPARVNADRYLAGGVAFGPFVSRNITPNEDGLPAGLTFAGFRQVMRTGIDPDNEHPDLGPLLQVMPWPVYGQMSDRDLLAVYEYLRSIPSIPGDED